jgi:DNA repair photolyase
VSQGDGIRIYTGEFLMVPWGLEWSGNWCSHDCYYCFANHTKPERRADPRSVLGLLAGFPSRQSREAALLRAGVPMLVSNHVDPFAGSNAEMFQPVWEVCIEMGVPLSWQTRGAHKPQRKILDRIISETPRSIWYVSIPMIDDDIRKGVEPHAPNIESRFELVEQLVEAGHLVTIGINPLCIEWLPDYEPLVDRLKNLGVWGVWIEPLYFGKAFKSNMRQKYKQALGQDFIKNSGEVGSSVDGKHVLDCADYVKSAGLEVFYSGYEEPTRFFEPAQEIYANPMPYWHQIINTLDPFVDEEPELPYTTLTKDEMLEILNPLPELDWSDPLRHKRARHYRAITNPVGKLPKQDVSGFWDIVWNDEIFCKSMGLLRYSRFAYASIEEEGKIQPLLDEEGNKIMVYSREGWDSLYANTPELA